MGILIVDVTYESGPGGFNQRTTRVRRKDCVNIREAIAYLPQAAEKAISEFIAETAKEAVSEGPERD